MVLYPILCILVSLEGITTLQKSLFSRTFLWDSRLFSVEKEWRQFRQQKPPWFLMLFLLIMQVIFELQYFELHPSPFGIIKRMICFLRFEFCFETKTVYILFFFSIQNIKSNCYIIFLNFLSNHLFLMSALFLPSYIYIIKIHFFYSFVFFFDSFWFFHGLTRLLQRVEKNYLLINGVYCCFFVFYRITRIYIWSTTFKIYLMTFII